MKISLAAALAALASLSLAGAAGAATLMSTNGSPLTYMVHNSVDPDGLELDMHTQPGDFDVDYTSDTTLHNAGSSNGFAQVDGPGLGGGVGFEDLMISLDAPLYSFSAIKFKFETPSNAPSAPKNAKINFTFNTRVFFIGGGFQDILATSLAGDNRYEVKAETKAGVKEQIKAVFFSDMTGAYSITEKVKNNTTTTNYSNMYFIPSIKQVSFDANFASPSPEPATWVSMLLGFGAMGATLRRRRSRLARVTA